MIKRETPPAGSTVAVTWEYHRRMESLCSGLGVPLFVMAYPGRGIGRYLRLSFQTISFLCKVRPRVLLVQNPSLVLTLLAYLLRPFLGQYRLIVDAHNEAVEPYIHTRWGVPQIGRFLLRQVDLTIVTNAQLERRAVARGAQVFVLPDRLPLLPLESSAPPVLDGPLRVMVVSTYAPDEPITEILEAASELGGEFAFSVTGRDSKLSPALRAKVPANVRLTGFLEEHDYWKLMSDSHVVLDLTSMPDCLVCGAYESLALGRPMILTDNPATKALFGEVAVTTDTSASSIKAAVLEARERYRPLANRMERAREEYGRVWAMRAALLVNYIRDARVLSRGRA